MTVRIPRTTSAEIAAASVALEDVADVPAPAPTVYTTAQRLAARRAADAEFFDDAEGARLRDLDGRLTALERGGAARSRRRTWSERIVSFLLGSGLAIVVWAMARADQHGDERATAREREAERIWTRDAVRTLLDHDAKREGQLEMLQDRLRYYPVHGPSLPGAATP